MKTVMAKATKAVIIIYSMVSAVKSCAIEEKIR